MTNDATVFVIDFAALTVPPPTPTELSAPFWAAAAEGRLKLQRCADCRRFAAYPREICAQCWGRSHAWEDVGGFAHVETFTRVHQAGNAGWQVATPYVLALVRLAEGPVLLTHLLVDGRVPCIGAACRVAFTKVGDWTLPFFRLTDDVGSDDSGAPS